MGAPSHLAIPEPLQHCPSFPSPPFSPDSCPSSSSHSFGDCSSSSFSRSFSLDGDPVPNIHKLEEQQEQRFKHNISVLEKTVSLEKTVCRKDRTKFRQITKSPSAKLLRGCKIASVSCTKGASLFKSACQGAGAFAADCAAVSCCPCAVFSLLFMVLIELPSSIARKTVTRLQRQQCMKEPASLKSREGVKIRSICTPSWSHGEAFDVELPANIIWLPSQSLVEYFEAEHVGFGCLSQERE